MKIFIKNWKICYIGIMIISMILYGSIAYGVLISDAVLLAKAYMIFSFILLLIYFIIIVIKVKNILKKT